MIGLVVGASYGILALVDRVAYDTAWLPAWFTSRWTLPAIREHPFADRVPPWLNPVVWAAFCVAGSAYIVFIAFW